VVFAVHIHFSTLRTFSPFMMGKKGAGGTLFLPILLQWKNSGGYTFLSICKMFPKENESMQ